VFLSYIEGSSCGLILEFERVTITPGCGSLGVQVFTHLEGGPGQI